MTGILRAGAPDPQAAEKRAARGLLAALLALWAALALPLALGERTLLLRDVFTTALPTKAFGAAELAAGRIPAVDPGWALGQVFRGDPNTLAFYPGNLLYLALPFWSAFNLHFALHWLLGLFTMRELARQLGRPPLAALLCGLTWAGCGYGLTTLSFHNLVVVAAWWPLAMAGALRGGRRGWALCALALGLALLGGEPVSAALGLVPLAVAAVGRHGARRGLAGCLVAGCAGLVVAAPQLVASARAVGFSTRAVWGTGEVAGRFALHPVRLLELLLPLPFGWPTRYGVFDYWNLDWFPVVPFVFSLHLGVVGLLLALAAARHELRWAALAAAGLLLAWAGGAAPGLFTAASAGLFRYPEKLLLWFILGATLLAGGGVARWPEWATAHRRALGASAAVLSLLGLALLVGREPAAVVLGRWMDHVSPAAPLVQVRLAAVALLAAGGLIGAAFLLRRHAAALVGLQLLGLLQLAPLWATDETAPYRAGSPWRALLPEGARVARFAALERIPAGAEAPETVAARARLDLADLDAAPGVLHGLRYPLAPDLVGLQSPLSARLELELRRLPWSARVNWLRRLGADALVVRGEGAGEAELPLRELAVRRHGGFTSRLFAVAAPATNGRPPLGWWPREVAVEADARAAAVRLGEVADPVLLSLTPRPVAHRPGATVRPLAESPDRLAFEVEGDGGLLVIRRAFLPLYRARLADGSELATGPVDLALLGVEVPAGRQQVLVEISGRPELAAAGVGLATLLVLACLALAPPR
jgi:hypothetical protein